MSEPEESSITDPHRGDVWQLPDELKSLEAQLSALRPREDRLARERLIFLAGQASALELASPRRTWTAHPTWPAAFAAMTALAATLLGLLVTRPTIVEPPALRSALVARSEMVSQHVAVEPPGKILSASDLYRLGFDQLLAATDVFPVNGDQASETTLEGSRVHTDLTPAAWNQILETPEFSRPPSKDSSHLQSIPGVHS
jgi:hypothetical protein